MNYGAMILIFGLFLVGRGLLDVFRSGSVADRNRRRNKAVREGRALGVRATFYEMRNPHAETSSKVKSQGRNVLWCGGALCVIGIAVMIFFN